MLFSVTLVEVERYVSTVTEISESYQWLDTVRLYDRIMRVDEPEITGSNWLFIP